MDSTLIKIIDIITFKDHRGELSYLEYHELGFKIKRVYWLYNLDANSVRGRHAHKLLKQILICVSGSVTVELDDGVQKEQIILNDPSKGLLIKEKTWRTLKDFSPNTIILVLASELYSEDDYYRDYNEFLHANSIY